MNKFLNRASGLFLLCLGVFPQIWMILDTLDGKVDAYFPLWLLLICVFTWVSANFRKGLLFGLPLSALTLYCAYRFYDTDLVAELFSIFDKITGVYYEHIFSPGNLYQYTDYADSCSLILLFLGFMLAAYLAASLTSQSGRVFMSCLGTVPFFAACIAVNGTPPIPGVVGMLLFWSLLLIGGGSYLPEGKSGIATLLTTLPILALLCVLLYIHDPDSYVFDQRDIDISQRFDQISQALSRLFDEGPQEFAAPYAETIQSLLSSPETPDISHTNTVLESAAPNKSGWQTGTGDMDLALPFDLDTADDVLMEARADVRGTLYLRATSYGNYAGDRWEQADEPETGSSLAFAALAIAAEGGRTHHLDLRPHTVFTAQQLPYFSTLSSSSDCFVPSQSRSLYSGSFYTMPENVSALTVPAENAEKELAYRSFAHSYYVHLPPSTAQTMLTLAAAAGIRAEDPNVIQLVADYVQNAGEYDLLTEPYPSSDYAVYFLTEAHRGYCIHFATAATAMYRALGIPARVADGYLLSAKAGEFVPVAGVNAHAWVEVYQDGLGWLPVEVTGQNSADAFAELEPEALNEEGSGDDAVDEASGTQPVPMPQEAPAMPVGILQGPDESTTVRPFPWKAVILGSVPVLLALLLLGWIWWIRRWVKARIEQPDNRLAAVALWAYSYRYSKFGVAMPETVVQCAEKAAFSQHTISDEEIASSRAAYADMLQSAAQQLKLPQRLYLQFLRGLR